ncbi:MAG: hypothetical protein JNL13_00130 [Chitinophagaceae bacterium]|nr:hypothetical protein [Chitinophagaceae bacterium]
MFILFLSGYSIADAQRTIAPNDPVYFRQSYIQAKEQFYLLSAKRATAHYSQFYNDVARQKRAKEIALIELYPDSLETDTNLMINQVHIEKYHKGFLTEELRLKYLWPAGNEKHTAASLRYDTLDWKQYVYTNRKRTVSVRNKRYGASDNYTDSLRTFSFNRRKRLVRTLSSTDTFRQTDTRFAYNRRGELVRVTSVLLAGQAPVEEKCWELRYSRQAEGRSLPQKILDSAAKIPALAFVGQQLKGAPEAAKKIVVSRFERLPQEQTMTRTGADSVCINRTGDYYFVLSLDAPDTAVQIRKTVGKLAVHRVYLELGMNDERKRVFRYTTRQMLGGSIVYENNFRGTIVSGSCSPDIEKTIITDTEDSTVKFYRIRR